MLIFNSKIFSYSVETVEVSMMKLKIFMAAVLSMAVALGGAMGKCMELLVA